MIIDHTFVSREDEHVPPNAEGLDEHALLETLHVRHPQWRIMRIPSGWWAWINDATQATATDLGVLAAKLDAWQLHTQIQHEQESRALIVRPYIVCHLAQTASPAEGANPARKATFSPRGHAEAQESVVPSAGEALPCLAPGRAPSRVSA